MSLLDPATPFYHAYRHRQNAGSRLDLSYHYRPRIRFAMLRPASLVNFAAPSDFSIAQWRWAIFFLAVGVIVLTIGIAAVRVFFYRRRATDRTPLYFGLYVILYAVRIFLREPALLSVFAISPIIAGHIIRTITFTFNVPLLFMFLELVETRWRRVILWALGVQLVYAAIAITLDLSGIARRAVDITNSLLVLASWILLTVFLFILRPPGRLPRELRVVAVGLGINGLFVLHANLVGLGLIGGRDLEPIGFLAFVFSLGYLVAHRTFAKEESLFAIQKELEIAEQIQTSILPRDVPRLPGLEIAARYRPMGAVAGDFYDFLTFERNYLGILIADVTGHGVPAALIASMLKVAFASQSAHAQDPTRVLTGLNQALCGKFEDHFVTAAYLYVDLDAKIIRYAGAGHPPLLFTSRSKGEARSIEQNGLFLGMFPEATYSSIEMPLHPEDRYVLYTDGLPESRNATGEEFGIARCLKVLNCYPRLAAAALADQLLSDITSWTAQGAARLREDDMTLIVVDCKE
jgi:sigma-B regulation protein RsbU (phosphoserine phosphatase)